MLAYSSIENMGVIAFGVGIGGLGLYGAMLHLIHHSLIKSSLFLSAGNMLLGFGTKLVDRMRRNWSRFCPETFLSFFAGFIGISGLPPFGIFVSELLILIGAFQTGHPWPPACSSPALILVVAGLAGSSCHVVCPSREEVLVRNRRCASCRPYALLLTSALLCVWMPEPLYRTILNTIAVIGGTIHG